MKKILVIGLMLILALSLMAELQVAPKSPIPVLETNKTVNRANRDRVVPNAEFVLDPIVIKTNNFYDYQFGAYDGYPIELQPTGTGLYLTYMFKVSATGRRSQNFAYVYANGDLGHEGGLTTDTQSEGFGTLAIDPVTENPFFSWHAQYAGMADLGVHVTADNYALIPGPNQLFPRSLVINNSLTPADSSFIWPVVLIGPSPTADHRRVHIFAPNSGTRPQGNPSSNVMYAYADFNTQVFDETDLTINWNYKTFPYLDAIHNAMLFARAFPSYAVRNNYVIIGGDVSAEDGITSPTDSLVVLYPPHSLFYLVNDNYGDGEFTLHTFTTEQSIDPPTNEAGAVDPAENYDYKIDSATSNHKELVIDNYGKVHFPATYVVTFSDDTDGRKVWINTHYTKDVTFDLDTHEIKILDVDPQGDFPNDGEYVIPWDLDNDGTPDSFTEGTWNFEESRYPVTYHDYADMFHYNYFRISQANQNGWMAMVWNDTYKAYRFNAQQDEDYQTFASAPEVYMSFSADNGINWSEPIIMNGVATDENFVPQFANMIPTFFYVAPQVEILDADWGKIHLMFMNDNSYGSYIQTDGANTGGNVMYTSMKVKFSDLVGNDINPVHKNTMLKQNYPNPFNPTTKISFDVKNTEKVNVSVYNVKGQLVKTLTNQVYNSGSHTVVWNGNDDNNNNVGSGIYFYRLSTPNHTEVKKMVLVK